MKHYVVISLDVMRLFTDVLWGKTINIMLRKAYNGNLIRMKISKENLEQLLLICTQGTPFTFDNKMDIQVDGVTMGSPLGPLFTNIVTKEFFNPCDHSL